MYGLMVKFFMYALVFQEAKDTVKTWRKSLKDIRKERRQYFDAWQKDLREMVYDRSIDPSEVTQFKKPEPCLEVLKGFQEKYITHSFAKIDSKIDEAKKFINAHNHSLETTFKSYKQYYECMGFTEMTEVALRKHWQESSFKKYSLNPAIKYLKLDSAWYHLEKFQQAWDKFKTMAVSPCTRDRPWLKSKVEQQQSQITKLIDQWIINWIPLSGKFSDYSERIQDNMRHLNNEFFSNEIDRYDELRKHPCKKN